jgi:hypothetical protein
LFSPVRESKGLENDVFSYIKLFSLVNNWTFHNFIVGVSLLIANGWK